jgi:hypothetical protein
MPIYRITLLFICLLAFNFNLKAQLNNTELEQNIQVNDSLTHQVLLSVSNQNFLRNNEYFHDITTGYTLFGSLLNTQIAYLPNPHLRLQAGAFFRKDFGNPKLKSIEPMLSLKYQQNNFSVLIGNLEGNFSHRLIEPLYNYERFITHYNENGIQVKFDKKKIWSDTWINWEVMEYNKSDYQEEFAAGNSTNYYLIKNDKRIVSIPFQGIITHKGGQVDVDTNAIQSKVNLALGITYQQNLNGFLKSIDIQSYYCIYRELGLSNLNVYTKGSGYYINASATSKYNISLACSYWNGRTFLAPRGGDLFQSISSAYAKTGKLEPKRALLFTRIMYQKKMLDNFYIDLRIEPYFDLLNHFFEHSQSIYLTYKNDFSLYKLKK